MIVRDIAGGALLAAGPLLMTAAVAAMFDLFGEQAMEAVVMGAIYAVGIAALACIIWMAWEAQRNG